MKISDSYANGASFDAFFFVISALIPVSRYNQLGSNRARAPEIKRDLSGEASWTKYIEEACYLEVAKRVRGTLVTGWSNTTCSALTSVQRLRTAPPQPCNPALMPLSTYFRHNVCTNHLYHPVTSELIPEERFKAVKDPVPHPSQQMVELNSRLQLLHGLLSLTAGSLC